MFRVPAFRGSLSTSLSTKLRFSAFTQHFSLSKQIQPEETTQSIRISYGRKSLSLNLHSESTYTYDDLKKHALLHWGLNNQVEYHLETHGNDSEPNPRIMEMHSRVLLQSDLSKLKLVEKTFVEPIIVALTVPETIVIEPEPEPEPDDIFSRMDAFCNSQFVINSIHKSRLYKQGNRDLRQSLLLFKDQMLKLSRDHLLQISKDSTKQEFESRLLPLFLVFANRQLKPQDNPIMNSITDLKNPHQWYMGARKIKRKIVAHLGPTNSGKTYSALKRLKEAKSGLYCGPLRLLAHEVREKLVADGVACDLLTGQEVIQMENATHQASTVEMANLHQHFECAVIDEIQMISSPDRGWAWSRALLGIMADEIHICGDPAALDLIQRITEKTDDEFVVNHYERLSPLNPNNKPLGSLVKGLSKGDCVIAFSRKEIFNIKASIEKARGIRCCVVYGGLAPEVRREQARLFNDPESGYDVLVASDAVGMGLNLNIRRIIFNSTEKFDGIETRPLTPTEIKQIAGRAGRYNTQFQSGEVSCLTHTDTQRMMWGLQAPIIPLAQAGLQPSYEHFQIFANCFNKPVPFSKLIDLFVERTQLDGNYFICDFQVMKEVALLLDPLHMTLKDRFTFGQSPVDTKNPTILSYLMMYATEYANGSALVRLSVNLENLVSLPPKSQLLELESMYQVVDLYMWLAYRFEEFGEIELAQDVKQECSEMIRNALEELDHTNPVSPIDLEYYERFLPKTKRDKKAVRHERRSWRNNMHRFENKFLNEDDWEAIQDIDRQSIRSFKKKKKDKRRWFD